MALSQDDAKRLYIAMKSGGNVFSQNMAKVFPNVPKDNLVKLQTEIITQMTEAAFCKWAAKEFRADAMPPVKLKPEVMQGLSGGFLWFVIVTPPPGSGPQVAGNPGGGGPAIADLSPQGQAKTDLMQQLNGAINNIVSSINITQS